MITLMITTEAVDAITRDGLVDLPDIVRATGVTRRAFEEAMHEGLIKPTDIRRGRGRGGAQTFTQEDAIFLMMVAALAVLAGVAFVSALKLMKQSGAQVNGNAITITLPAGPVA